ASGLKVEILSGEQEADLVFQGVASDGALATEPLLLLDVGGGSTEFILGKGEQKHFRASFAVGSVRLIEILPVGDPPTTEELIACRQWLQTFLQNEVEPKLQPAMQCEGAKRIPPSDRVPKAGPKPNALRLVGTGGTA